MEKTITMSLDEFEKLTNENKRMRKILKDKSIIAIQHVYTETVFTKNTWNIITKDELVKELVLIIERTRQERDKASRELADLKWAETESLKKKKRWF
jgi:hypothetical protein